MIAFRSLIVTSPSSPFVAAADTFEIAAAERIAAAESEDGGGGQFKWIGDGAGANTGGADKVQVLAKYGATDVAVTAPLSPVKSQTHPVPTFTPDEAAGQLTVAHAVYVHATPSDVHGVTVGETVPSYPAAHTTA